MGAPLNNKNAAGPHRRHKRPNRAKRVGTSTLRHYKLGRQKMTEGEVKPEGLSLALAKAHRIRDYYASMHARKKRRR